MPPVSRLLVPVLVALALAALAPAQTSTPLVDPAPFGHLRAPAATGIPFGYPSRPTFRLQQVHDGAVGDARTVSAIALRRAAGDSGKVPAFTATVTLRLGSSPRTAATVSARFDDNLGADATTLLDRATVSLPASDAPPSTGPAPFEHRLTGTRPHAHDGKRPLCVEIVVHGHTSRTPFAHAMFASEADAADAFGEGCLDLELAATWGAKELVFEATSLPAAVPLVFLVGTDVERLGSLRLPIDLTPLGAPGCSLAVAPLLDLTGFADDKGVWQTTVPVAAAPPGLAFAGQVAIVKPGLNRLGIGLTNPAMAIHRTPRVAGRVWSDRPEATTGLDQPVFAAVLELR